MQNFVLHNQTKIIFGGNRLDEIGPETKKLGSQALLVYGQKSCKEHGILARVMASLQQHGITVTEHGGVQSNPMLSHVRQGIDKAKAHNIDVVVAVGGGSVIDSAKAISAGCLVEHDVWKFFNGKKGIKKSLPVACVLTLAAAGSEMNGGMVITHDDKRLKFGTGNQLLQPKVSILDPTLTFTVPADYTAYGAVDAIAHILEFYCTTSDPSTPVQDRFMEGLVVNIMESCDKVLAAPHEYHGRADLMWCATLALNGWTAAGLGRVGFPMHMIEHTLSAHYDVAHGAGLSVVMPAWLRYQAQRAPGRYAQLARRIFGVKGDNLLSVALEGIGLLKNWLARIGCPTCLEELGIGAEQIALLAQESLPLAKLWRLHQYDREKIEAILRGCLEGEK